MVAKKTRNYGQGWSARLALHFFLWRLFSPIAPKRCGQNSSALRSLDHPLTMS
jgi:hypothetical protein